MGAFGAGDNGAYATVGLHDWASTDTAAGAAGTAPYTIMGGSQVAGFYQTNGITTAGNYDVVTTGVNTLDATGASTIRFTHPNETTITFSAATASDIQGILVTPAMVGQQRDHHERGPGISARHDRRQQLWSDLAKQHERVLKFLLGH